MLSGIMCKLKARQLTDFSVLPCGVQALEGIERGTERDRDVAEFRDRPFILKSLFFYANLCLGNRVRDQVSRD